MSEPTERHRYVVMVMATVMVLVFCVSKIHANEIDHVRWTA